MYVVLPCTVNEMISSATELSQMARVGMKNPHKPASNSKMLIHIFNIMSHSVVLYYCKNGLLTNGKLEEHPILCKQNAKCVMRAN